MCEFVTGGGLRNQPIPPSLAREGAMMRDALIRDLSEIPGVTLVTTHDDRLGRPQGVASVAVTAGRDPWRLWAYCAEKAEVAWAIAPETDGLLVHLIETLTETGAIVIGPTADAIRIASSKRATAEALIAAGVPALPVWTPEAVPSYVTGPFVAKPDDGAGCERTWLSQERLDPTTLPPGHVVQLFEEGEAASLTVLKADGVVTLLAANRQHVTIDDGVFAFRGLTVGAYADDSRELARLAEAVAKAIPGLDAIFGIDVVIGARGPMVIEVNPRLTTSYAALRDSLGLNPATLVAPFARQAQKPAADRRFRPIEIAL